MCHHDIIHHLDCGHESDRVTRCTAFCAALVYFHQQPDWNHLPLPLQHPTCCPTVRDPPGGVTAQTLAVQVRWDRWLGDLMEYYGLGVEEQADIKALVTVGMPERLPEPPVGVSKLPYPFNHFQIYTAIKMYQERPDQVPNATVVHVDGGCGRSGKCACLGLRPTTPFAPGTVIAGGHGIERPAPFKFGPFLGHIPVAPRAQTQFVPSATVFMAPTSAATTRIAGNNFAVSHSQAEDSASMSSSSGRNTPNHTESPNPDQPATKTLGEAASDFGGFIIAKREIRRRNSVFTLPDGPPGAGMSRWDGHWRGDDTGRIEVGYDGRFLDWIITSAGGQIRGEWVWGKSAP
ncbi:hypothetical protein MMC28_000014 [Mycoblastus sanguinarius]|nr:hypothetical protein [Mycoblastus sanguinarius]